MIKQPTNKRRRYVEESADASHSTLVERKEEEPTVEEKEATNNEASEEEITASDRLDFEKGLSRRQRKSLKKQDKREKRMALVDKIQKIQEENNKKKPKQQQKKKDEMTFDFEPISKLLAAEDVKPKDDKMDKETSVLKKKNKKMKSEIEQFNNVLNHPVFQSNPLASIQQHLRNKMKVMNPNASTTSPSQQEVKKTRRKGKVAKRTDDSFDKTKQTSSDPIGKRKRND